MKRTVSMLLAIAMVISILPMAVFAADIPAITFETDFTNDLAVGDTFKVTGILSGNELFGAMTLSLKWNDKAVAFTGFDADRRGALVTDVFTYTAPVINQELGIIVATDAYGFDTNGQMFVANFEIVGEGELGIGLKTDSLEEFVYCDVEGTDLDVEIDLSAVTGLTVGGKPAGPEMPEDAPFTAITTDAGPIVAIEEADWVNDVPYYIVTIPADAKTAYVTAPDQVVMEDWTTGELQATAYASDLSFSGEPLYISYNYEDTADGPKVEIPMNMWASDWSGEVELDFINTHAFGIEDAGYACLGWISFVYDDGLEEYNISIDENMVGGTIYARDEDGNEISKAKAGETVFVNVEADEGYTTTGAYYINGQIADDFMFVMPEEDVVLTATFKPVETEPEPSDPTDPTDPVEGYTFATSADVTAENGGSATVRVKITGHSDESVTSYNAYDITLTFDSDKLEYVSYAGAVLSDGGEVKVEGNTIRIVGCGAAKDFGTEIAALTFNTKAEGAADVTISKVQVSDKQEAVTKDIPEASAMHSQDDTQKDETPDVSLIVVPYSVEKPQFVSGNESVLPGENYTFSFADTDNYTYSDLTVLVGGAEADYTEENGVYTIENVTGAIVITATQNANRYDVDKPENVSGSDQATYGEDYIFTVTPDEGYAVDSVTVTVDGETVSVTVNEDGAYVIPGSAITGEIAIIVEQTAVEPDTTTVTFSGITEDEIEGGLTQIAEVGKDFTFTLLQNEDYTYTVKVGDTELFAENGIYTIPAALMTDAGVSVSITKTKIKNLTLEVAEYFNLDGQTMFLITAKWDENVLSYNGQTMFWSDKYDAYCWLVVSGDTRNDILAAAEAAIDETADSAVSIAYDCDVNRTGKVDVNDAQLVYDMYNASYDQFTTDLPMRKFLEADLDGSKNLDTKDVAAIISVVIAN